eukprot:8791293-Pyramimonas_sp.AAC.1
MPTVINRYRLLPTVTEPIANPPTTVTATLLWLSGWLRLTATGVSVALWPHLELLAGCLCVRCARALRLLGLLAQQRVVLLQTLRAARRRTYLRPDRPSRSQRREGSIRRPRAWIHGLKKVDW